MREDGPTAFTGWIHAVCLNWQQADFHACKGLISSTTCIWQCQMNMSFLCLTQLCYYDSSKDGKCHGTILIKDIEKVEEAEPQFIPTLKQNEAGFFFTVSSVWLWGGWGPADWSMQWLCCWDLAIIPELQVRFPPWPIRCGLKQVNLSHSFSVRIASIQHR